MARIKLGLQDQLYLGNMNALRDWGHARDYVEMMWLMLQQERPSDFVIATGRQFSVRDFVRIAARELGVELEFRGEGQDEVGVDVATGKVRVSVDPRYYRPTEVETLLGDPGKAMRELGWAPKISFEELVKEMVVSDLRDAERDALCKGHGFTAYDYHE
jgi:GDPmannose 4,6-dehydratase